MYGISLLGAVVAGWMAWAVWWNVRTNGPLWLTVFDVALIALNTYNADRLFRSALRQRRIVRLYDEGEAYPYLAIREEEDGRRPRKV